VIEWLRLTSERITTDVLSPPKRRTLAARLPRAAAMNGHLGTSSTPSSTDDHGGGGAVTRTRRIVLLIVLAFVIYSVLTDPNTSAGYVRDAFVLLAAGVQKIFQFFTALLQ
jgi:hypothetical protein